MKKRKILIAIGASFGIVVILAAILFAVAIVKHQNGDLFGVRQVKITESISGENTLVIDYWGIYGYHVETMDENDLIFRGEKQVKEDGLGKYRIAIYYTSAGRTTSLRKQYPGGKIHTLENVPADCKGKYNIKFSRLPDDSTSVIYIGSDEPFSIVEQDTTIVNYNKGSIKIRLME